MEDLIKEVEAEAEKLFTPKPGGMIDRWHQEEARRQEAQREAENRDEPVTEPASFAVKVTPLSPEITSVNTISIQPGSSAIILPKSPQRYRATILVNGSATLNLAKDASQALGGVGFPLPAGIPLVINSRAQLWGFNSTAAVVQVSVISELYAANA